jgi:hypothetical protein
LLFASPQKSEPPVGVPAARAWGSEGNYLKSKPLSSGARPFGERCLWSILSRGAQQNQNDAKNQACHEHGYLRFGDPLTLIQGRHRQ